MTLSRIVITLIVVLLGQMQLACVDAAEKPASGSFDANGVKIRYSVKGRGEPVVLIHGWLSSGCLNWDLPGITTLLARDYQVITLDVRGHGLSDKPTKDESYGPELVEDVVRLLDQLKIKKAHIVGYSMGGIIAANFIVKHPDRVLSGTLGGMGWLQKGGLAEWWFAQIGKDGANAKAAIVCGRSLAKLALTKKEISSIHVPVTILIGDKDVVKPLYVDPLKRVRKDWPVVEIKGGDHVFCIAKPQFREELKKWLDAQKKKE
jgi:pimeloyl-ACP methyl ester carboxylesterase